MPMMTVSQLVSLIELRKAQPAPQTPGHVPDPEGDKRYPGDDTWDTPAGPEQTMQGTLFYYFGQRPNGTFRTLAYESDGETRADDQQLLAWIEDARNPNPSAAHDDLDQVQWDRPEYLVFFVDIPGAVYLHHGGKNKSLNFVELIEDGEVKYHANHSFYGAETLPLTIDGVVRELLIVRNNHFAAPIDGGEKYKGRPAHSAADKYKFDLFIGIPIDNGTGKKIWFIIDPGGENTGP